MVIVKKTASKKFPIPGRATFCLVGSDNKTIAVICDDTKLIEVDFDGKVIHEWATAEQNVHTMAFSEDMKYLAVGCTPAVAADGAAPFTLIVYDRATKDKVFEKTTEHVAKITAIAFSHTTNTTMPTPMIASASSDGVVNLFDMPAGALQRTIKTSENIAGIAFAQARAEIAIGHQTGFETVNPNTGDKIRDFPSTSPVVSLCYACNGAWVLCGHKDGVAVMQTNLNSVSTKQKYRGHSASSTKAVSRNGTQTVTLGERGYMCVWSVVELVAKFEDPDMGRQIAITPDGTSVVVSCESKHLAVWDITAKSVPISLTAYYSNYTHQYIDPEDVKILGAEPVFFDATGKYFEGRFRGGHRVLVKEIACDDPVTLRTQIAVVLMRNNGIASQALVQSYGVALAPGGRAVWVLLEPWATQSLDAHLEQSKMFSVETKLSVIGGVIYGLLAIHRSPHTASELTPASIMIQHRSKGAITKDDPAFLSRILDLGIVEKPPAPPAENVVTLHTAVKPGQRVWQDDIRALSVIIHTVMLGNKSWRTTNMTSLDFSSYAKKFAVDGKVSPVEAKLIELAESCGKADAVSSIETIVQDFEAILKLAAK